MYIKAVSNSEYIIKMELDLDFENKTADFVVSVWDKTERERTVRRVPASGFSSAVEWFDVYEDACNWLEGKQ